MAFSTLNAVRATLNSQLGIDSDADNSFGSVTIRNAALQQAFAWLWPTMGRLQREDITLVAGEMEYDLATVRDVRLIDRLDSTGVATSQISGYRVLVDESDSANAPVYRLRLFSPQSTDGSARAVGYTPYLVPASGTDTCDLPDRLLFIPVLGAKAQLYENMLNKHIVSQQRGSENPATSESTSELLAMYNTTWQKFVAARESNRAGLNLPRTASPRRK